jgi:hypothetical protein
VHCPLGTLITELGRHSPAARAVTGRLIERWQNDLHTGITVMQQRGQISADLDAARTAAAVVAAIQGGVTILMSTGSSQHLEAALDTMLLFLRGEASTTAAPVAPCRTADGTSPPSAGLAATGPARRRRPGRTTR